MTRPSQFHSGSALLIVLGMMSFLLFSGLAFSVYMRYSRLPTSFLRRTTTTRQLAKAALAEAIEEIDIAIGDNPHPGVNPNGYTSGVISNVWHHRVFFGVGLNGRTEDSIAPDYTMPSTLTLEGLAYLPPNMINDVRYYSRCTPTSDWHPFWFDSGRYAYTAVDVSDYFDVNKVLANKGRAACGSRRISLAHLFETGGVDHSGAGSGAQKWDNTLMAQCRTVDDKTGEIEFTEQGPFISLADFNIAWNQNGAITFGSKSIQSPFVHMVDGDGTPYGKGLTSADPNAEYYRQLTFVTESWTPSDSVGKTPDGKKKTVDLTAEQPFDINDLHETTPSLDRTVMRYQSDLLKTSNDRANLYDHICLLGYAQLWDYLDPDNIPVSLAIPTLERVPMIVGVEPRLPSIQVEKSAKNESQVSGDGKKRRMRREQTYNLKLATQNVGAKVLAAYPFRPHGVEENDDSFQVDGRIAIFFTLDGQNMSLRPGDANEALQLKKNDVTTGGFLNDSIMSIPLSAQNVTATDIAKNADQPVKAVSLTGKIGDVSSGTKFLTVVYEWDQQNVEGQWLPENPTENDIVENGTEFAFRPLSADGTPSKAPDGFVSKLKSGEGLKLKVNAAVWARVSQSDKTVDLVPACLLDDDELNGAQNGSSMLNQLGKAYPLLRFDATTGGSDGAMTISVSALDDAQPQALSIDNAKAIVNDPRYNHMPENWYTLSGTGLTEQDWMTETAKMVGQGDCDSDVFMFTSDRGYMQSVYELAYLPRFGGLTKDTKGDPRFGTYMTSRTKNIDRDFTSLPTSYSDVLDYNVMWRTYRCFGSNRDDFENIGLVCGATGPRVNPYSDSTNVLMAAFANTPHDWRVSVTNMSSLAKLDAATFNGQHAWNAYSSEESGKLCWDCLSKIAGAFSSRVRSSSAKWEDAFANLDWADSGVAASERHRHLAGVELDSDDASVYGVDKKFLYGFWHDSFGVQQQLFLIFVRAEPIMMGGGVAGQAPPQLGARAVALVWRDPNAFDDAKGSRGDSTPDIHRTRILFYHQFD